MDPADFQRVKEQLRLWWEKPQVFVREVFGVTPDQWQDEVLAAFPTNPRQALKACKGPGKTAVLAWLCWNFLVTRPHPKVAATSISSDNLRDNLWAEMAKWQNVARPGVLNDFVWTASRIFHKQFPETWWMSARAWSRTADQTQQANTLAGLHAAYVMAILDESGGIPDAVMATAEGIGSSSKEWHIIQAGNPTHLEGPLYRACTSERPLWWVKEITGDPDDPKRSSRISVQWAREQIQKYGRDNPWVLVNVFGKFPPSSINALIGPDEVREAQKRHYVPDQYEFAGKILGADVARFGDDASVITKRQGLVMFPQIELRNVDGNQGAGRMARLWEEWGADAAMIDATGGFGASWIDALRRMGREPLAVQFAGKPFQPKYFNKRTEMGFEFIEWIKGGGALPDSAELLADLCAITYTFKGDKLLLADKDEIKLQLGRSCDYFDSAICTFAFPVAGRNIHTEYRSQPAVVSEYDPFANAGA